VTRTSGKGIPEDFVMTGELDPAKADKRRGESKCAILKEDLNCPDLIACSVYDTKPVHMLSTIAKTVDWTIMQRKVYSAGSNSMVTLKYLRLNLIDQ
jgi:hypothetical protein